VSIVAEEPTFLYLDVEIYPMSVNIRAPSERRCLRCGRRESWNDDVAAWRVPEGEEGEVSCIHDWDVTGEFTPVER